MYRKLSAIVCSTLLSAAVAHAECSPTIPRSTAGHFVDNGNGTVTDTTTGLQWKKCSEGQIYDAEAGICSGTPLGLTWQEGLQHAEQLRQQAYAGRTDWRIPNIKELESIADEGCYQPAIATTYFPGTRSDWYWSATPVRATGTDVRAINFATASDSNPGIPKQAIGYVRLVAGPAAN